MKGKIMLLMQTGLWSSVAVLGYYCANYQSRLAPAPAHSKLVWSDEFDYTSLPDSTHWTYDLGDGCPEVCGWGNNELQYYTRGRAENARVENGHLIIEARREAWHGKAYTSARLVTRTKGDWRYGKIAVRARLPKGRGVWPAIWMLPVEWKYGGWPNSGEIDIMEHVGYEPDSVFGTVHTKAYNTMNGKQAVQAHFLPDAASRFHEYTIEWTPERMIFMIDNHVYHTFVNRGADFATWPFNQRFYLLLNLAVGGNWGGKMGVDDSIWPQRLEVDYVRVYQ